MKGAPLAPEELRRLDAFWRACNYLARGHDLPAGQPAPARAAPPGAREGAAARALGREPRAVVRLHPPEPRDPRARPRRAVHGRARPRRARACSAPSTSRAPTPRSTRTRASTRRGCAASSRQFSFPGGIGSHCTPETPGSIHEGGELGYVLSHACGAAFDNPDLIVAAVVGDGEAETGPLATSWHVNKFLNPIRDGAVLPVLSLNGYKINNPTLLARISDGRARRACSAATAGRRSSSRAPTPSRCTRRWRRRSTAASRPSAARRPRRAAPASPARPRWPMIVLRAPKGWTAPRRAGRPQARGLLAGAPGPDRRREGGPGAAGAARALAAELPARGALRRGGRARRRACARPRRRGARRMGANPHANGGVLKKALRMPDFRAYAVAGRGAGRRRRPRTPGRSARSCAT